jgi:methionine-rich copper-binding protein CopC
VTIRFLGALVGAVLAVLPAAASAHSLLLESVPAAGSSAPAPPRVTLRFNNRIEKRLSRVAVVDAQRVRHELSVVAAEGATDTLSALAPPLAPGAYLVEWQVLSADGHVVSGRYKFQVVP